ncbi:hypothetical protein BKA63DRAFT_514458 [Paraphoma chrysanthemicola]|nr:hypothetical protein BKA63DRAFT_514458 [Paraphoma chrysanthemicola]
MGMSLSHQRVTISVRVCLHVAFMVAYACEGDESRYLAIKVIVCAFCTLSENGDTTACLFALASSRASLLFGGYSKTSDNRQPCTVGDHSVFCNNSS